MTQAAARPDPVLPLFALALFVSALLGFWIQPLISKLVLPRFGGSAAVWTTASLFFQVMLLAGYLYAHYLSRTPLRTQLGLHALVVVAALAMLPVRVSAGDFGFDAPAAALLALLAATLGFPVFVLSATAPLLQQWFSRTGHAHAGDPYFLYSASNAGSLLALVGYPLLLEPVLGLREQAAAWSAACALFAALVAACGVVLWRERRGAAPVPVTARPAGIQRTAAVPWSLRARWLLLAFAPSSLMLGVTQHITSEIAAAPLLWLIPLTLYILTFILAFARTQLVPAAALYRVQPLLAILLALVWPINNQPSVMLAHLAVFAVTAMMCHAELARTRPPVAHLTAFYLCLAIGGAAGGAFNAIVAPLVFDSVLEYPLALALACALRSGGAAPNRWTALVVPVALAAAFAALYYWGFRPFAHGAAATVVYLQVVGVTLYAMHRYPRGFGLSLLIVLLASPHVHSAESVLERHRSFFGVHTVLLDEERKFHVLMHGVTIHGAQRIDAGRRLEPTTYFHADSAPARLLDVLGRRIAFDRIALVGLGVGTLSCYRAPGREWTFYEIDPLVAKLATDTRYFSFLTSCAPGARIVLGDGRLSLAREPDASYDLIVVDCFASDSIPAHLITREALAIYLRKLKPGGVVIFQATNQYLDLVPVLARLAADAGIAALTPGPRFDIVLEEMLAALPSVWVAMSKDASRLAPLIDEENWQVPAAARSRRVWTDDFSNILGAIK